MLAVPPLRERIDTGGPMFATTHDTAAPLGTFTRRLLVLGVLACAVALERIEVGLSVAHQAGEPSGTFGDIATPARLATPNVAVEIAAAWNAYEGVGSAPALITGYAVTDTLLMAFLAVLLLVLRRAVTTDVTGFAARWAWPDVAVAGYLLADLLETLVLATVWNAPLTEDYVKLIAGASLAKWLFLLVAVGSLVVSSLLLGKRVHLARALLALRGQLVVAGLLLALLLALSGPLGRQIDEVMVLAAEGMYPAALALLFGVLASISLAWGAARCAQAYEETPAWPEDGVQRRWGWGGVIALAVAVALTILGVTHLTSDEWDATLLAGAALAGLVGLLLVPSVLGRIRSAHWDDPTSPEPPDWLARVVADVPLLALFLAIVRAATTTATAGALSVPLAVFAVATALVWCCVHIALHVRLLPPRGQAHTSAEPGPPDLPAANASPNTPGTSTPVTREHASSPGGLGSALGLGAVACLLMVVAAGLPLDVYAWLGTPATLMLFSCLAALLTTALALTSDHIRVGGLLEVFHVARVPLFTLLLVWGLAASTADTRGAYFAVRTDGAAPSRPTIKAALRQWDRETVKGKALATGRERHVVPLVFVAAAGGGIRAAYWTRVGMECTFGSLCGSKDVSDRVFLASGVSGGSLGLASFRQRRFPRLDDQGTESGFAPDTALGGDFIAPTLAAFLFRDLPNSYLRLPLSGFNRADTLEQAWEGADPGLAEPFGTADAFPRLVLNSTSVEDGCRLTISEVTMDFPGNRQSCQGSLERIRKGEGPGDFPARDAFAHLCAADTQRGLRISTAAMLAARFPYVSPAGILEGCELTDRTFALDGGLVDNSGATAVEQAWAAVAAKVDRLNGRSTDVCLSPRLVIFDNDQVVTGSPGSAQRPLQVSAPLESIVGGFGRRSATPVARAAHAFTEAAKRIEQDCREAATEVGASLVGTVTDPVAVIAPREQPGPGLPLGWTLSAQSRRQMRCLLAGDHVTGTSTPDVCVENTSNWDEIQRVRGWFDQP